MLSLNPNQAKRVIESSMMTRTPVIMWGAPGIGKSNVVEQIAREMGAPLIDTRLSQFDSVDLRGIPNVRDGATYWNPPAIFPFVGNPMFDTPEHKNHLIIWFVDEILQALPAVQSVAFQLFLDRRIGEHVLLPNVRLIAATNRETDRAGTNRMLSPLANRFMHIEMVPHLDSWTTWAYDHGIDSRMIAFLRFRSDLLSTFDPTKNEKVFASPRTWEFLNRFLVQNLPMDLLTAAAHGTVGAGPGSEFLAFLDTIEDVPNPDAVLLDPEGTKVPPKTKPASLYAITSALAYRANKGTIDAICTYIRRLPPEYAARCMKDSVKRDSNIAVTKAFNRFVADYSDLMKL